ncbi:MAG: DUF4380 domain-containing protein [Bifidobacteriaceae bacterium]|nr:DUF4380 domain-containing protein [Bifidobacteriaceae bacterium]
MRDLTPLPGCPRDQQVFIWSNGSVEAAFLPAAGGRLLSLAVGGERLLWVSPEHFGPDLTPLTDRKDWPALDGTQASWSNLGGAKTWPAPQGWSGPGEWPGPPDGVLDSGGYTLAVEPRAASTRVIMTSAADRRTGLVIRRRFDLPDSGSAFSQTTTFTNVSTSPRSWAIWEVCQLDSAPGGGRPAQVLIESAPAPPARVMLSAWGRADPPAWRDGAHRLDLTTQVAKYAFPGASGRARFSHRSGAGLTLAHQVWPGATYPDQGARFELWAQCPIPHPLPDLGNLQPAAWYAELEPLGPLVRLAPGQSTELVLHWTCHQV